MVALKIPPPLYGLLVVLAIWTTHRLLPDYSVSVSYQSQLGLALIVFGALVDFIAIMAFRKARTTVNPMRVENSSTLVVTGCTDFPETPCM